MATACSHSSGDNLELDSNVRVNTENLRLQFGQSQRAGREEPQSASGSSPEGKSRHFSMQNGHWTPFGHRRRARVWTSKVTLRSYSLANDGCNGASENRPRVRTLARYIAISSSKYPIFNKNAKQLGGSEKGRS